MVDPRQCRRAFADAGDGSKRIEHLRDGRTCHNGCGQRHPFQSVSLPPLSRFQTIHQSRSTILTEFQDRPALRLPTGHPVQAGLMIIGFSARATTTSSPSIRIGALDWYMPFCAITVKLPPKRWVIVTGSPRQSHLSPLRNPGGGYFSTNGAIV